MRRSTGKEECLDKQAVSSDGWSWNTEAKSPPPGVLFRIATRSPLSNKNDAEPTKTSTFDAAGSVHDDGKRAILDLLTRLGVYPSQSIPSQSIPKNPLTRHPHTRTWVQSHPSPHPSPHPLPPNTQCRSLSPPQPRHPPGALDSSR